MTSTNSTTLNGGDGTLPLWPSAVSLAAKAHAGQLQKDGETPYIAHSCRVAMRIARDFDCSDDLVLAAAVLHDVLEKTDLTPEQLRDQVGEPVTEWVEWLSKGIKGPEKDYWDLLESSPWQAKLIKIADALDHLDCHLAELDHRLGSATKTLSLSAIGDHRLAMPLKHLSAAVSRAIARKTTAETNGPIDMQNPEFPSSPGDPRSDHLIR